jgi:hypothetical protein
MSVGKDNVGVIVPLVIAGSAAMGWDAMGCEAIMVLPGDDDY